jgi:MFS family permease
MAASSVPFMLFVCGADAILPLWATKDLGFTADEWATLRSARFFGVLVGMIVLGALSDRFGPKPVSAAMMLGIVGALLAMALGERELVWVIFPLFGAMMSTAFVNLNTLTQMISRRRQGIANTVYRGIGAFAGMSAPLLFVWMADAWCDSYTDLFYVWMGLLVVAALVLMLFPIDTPPRPIRNLRAELAGLWAGYRGAIQNRPLVKMIVLTQAYMAVAAGVGGFAAIRFTSKVELNQPDAYWATVSSTAAAVTFVIILAGALLLDRVSLKAVHVVCGILAALAAMFMGLTDSPLLSAVAFVSFGTLWTFMIAPNSMWVSRLAAPELQTSAFSVHKLVSAALQAVVMLLLGVLEPKIGIANICILIGIANVMLAIGFLVLKPAPPARTDVPEPVTPPVEATAE